MSQTVIGIFENKNEAHTAVQDLMSHGISSDKIDVSAQQSTGTDATTSRDADRDTDSFGDFFRSLFGSDSDEATTYSTAARGCWVVTVHADSAEEANRSAQTLDQYGAVDVNARAQGYGQGSSYSNQTAASLTDRDVSQQNRDSINVVEENLEVGKRTVETGGVAIRSRIVERPVEERLRLREEHVTVERNPVNRPATEADLHNFKEGEMRVTEHKEVPVVNKEARVVEEIRVGKEVESHEETIRDTVRKTEVDVENLRTDDTTRLRTDEDDLTRRRTDEDDLTRR